ncbi:cytochrome P450 [Collybia nuda]|uniref:Cytochrome P450 n=1 Tax=Collybia nuda TaxID=64659 RepID=A0A9P5Y7R9_9AGAR|nr:cytochrome P450 [Collybia nuda]
MLYRDGTGRLELALFGIVFSLSLFYAWRHRRRPKLPLPPGPRKLPVIGNLLDVGKAFEWESYHEMNQKYNSDVVHLSILGLSVIVLDTLEAVEELLVTRSTIYSDRPRMIMLRELAGWNWAFPFMHANEGWRQQRKMIHAEFSAKAVLNFRGQELKAAHDMLQRLLHSPTAWYDDMHVFLSAIFMSTIYGIDVVERHDPYIVTQKKANGAISMATTPGNFIVESLPLLKYLPTWFPFAEFKRMAVKWQNDAHDMLWRPIQVVRKDLATGYPTSSCASRGMLKLQDLPDDERPGQEFILQRALASMAPAGDTVLSALRSFVLEMTRRPEIQRKAQEELDSVLHGERLPVFSDQESMPYITALVKEILRFFPITPLGAPHSTSADDIYKGYFIPSGTVVLPNIWAILHDPKEYADPHVFNPDRFFNTKTHKAELDPSTAVFGFGRRICPGVHMVMDVLWLTVASVLSVFEIEKAIDPETKQEIPVGKFQERGVIVHPIRFECTIKPRSAAAIKLIQD